MDTSWALFQRTNYIRVPMQQRTGYHLYVVTVRKLSGSDPFAFADNVIESWYPRTEDGNNKGVLVLAKQSKDGALVGGPSFQEKVGDELVDSIVSDQIPYLAGQEKYNEAMTSTVERLSAKLEGQEVPDSPSQRTEKSKGNSSFKTRQETENKRGLYTKVVIGLLVVSFVAPMLQVRKADCASLAYASYARNADMYSALYLTHRSTSDM